MDSFSTRFKRAIFYLCLLAVFALLLKIGLFIVADSRAKLRRGLMTQALVTGKSIEFHRRYTDWNLHYKYTVGKTVYTGKYSVDGEKYNATKIGSRFIVTYLAESP